MEKEMLQRAKEMSQTPSMAGNPTVTEVQLRLSTIREINEDFWLKRGFTVSGEKTHPIGTYGSKTGFTTVEMFRVLA